MARDDDDDDRPRKKIPRDDEDDDDDRPRKKSAREEEDDADDEDRPRKKLAREEDDQAGKAKPMPIRLVGAIIASMAWGILVLHGSCVESSHSIMGIIHFHRAQDQMRGFGNLVVEGRGMLYTLAGTQVVMTLLGAILLAGGVALLARKGFGKYLAMGAPVGMALVQMAVFVICLIITSGVFLVHYNFAFFIQILFSLTVSGLNAYLLLNKDVSRVLK
jgi:hypothetical protein